MKGIDYKPKVKLIDCGGNIFAILGRIKTVLKKAGADKGSCTNPILKFNVT